MRKPRPRQFRRTQVDTSRRIEHGKEAEAAATMFLPRPRIEYLLLKTLGSLRARRVSDYFETHDDWSAAISSTATVMAVPGDSPLSYIHLQRGLETSLVGMTRGLTSLLIQYTNFGCFGQNSLATASAQVRGFENILNPIDEI